MKAYQSPEILFQGISPADVLTVSFCSLFDETEDGSATRRDKLSWGQINGDPQ